MVFLCEGSTVKFPNLGDYFRSKNMQPIYPLISSSDKQLSIDFTLDFDIHICSYLRKSIFPMEICRFFSGSYRKIQVSSSATVSFFPERLAYSSNFAKGF